MHALLSRIRNLLIQTRLQVSNGLNYRYFIVYFEMELRKALGPVLVALVSHGSVPYKRYPTFFVLYSKA